MSGSSVSHFRQLVVQYQQASHPELKLALTRIVGESRERANALSPDSSEFFESLWPALVQLRGTANAELRVDCFLECSKFFYFAGDIAQGAKAAREGIELARVVRNDELASKAYCYLGNALADSGAIAEGIEAFVSALELCQNKDLERRAIALINLGTALLYAGEYHDAIGCFDMAEDLSPKLTVFRAAVLRSSLSNRALCYLRLSRFADGLPFAQRAITAGIEPVDHVEALNRLIAECTYGHLLLEMGESRSAAKRLPAIRTLALQSDSQKARVMAYVIEGLVEIQRGDAARGLDLLCDARTEAQDVNSLVQDALIGLVKGYELLGRYSKALDCHQQLIHQVGAARQKCALIYLRALPELGHTARRTDDLTPLKHREALLRAKVAEEQLAWSQIEMLERLAITADLKEEASGEHGYRVGRLAAELADDLGMDSETCLAIDLAARLHDIGKIGVPDRILLTSQELKEAERHLMSQHTIIGAELLAKSNIEKLRLAEEIALYHHEWWDGTGYPKKLAGKRIPIHARIVALADMFDALTHGRPYAAPWDMDRATEEIRSRRGTQFDPDLTDRFVALIDRLRKEHSNLDEFLARAGRNSPFLQARRKIKLMLEQEREHERAETLRGNETRH